MRLLPAYVCCVALLAAAVGAVLPQAHAPHRYAENPPLAHTGGFGEPTCHACHFDQPLNAEAGALTLTGLPEAYTPGQVYRLTMTLRHPRMARGGFEVAARFAPTRSAGQLTPVDDRTTRSVAPETEVAYLHHTADGTALTGAHETHWTIDWTAPADGDSVVFHAAANAANYDASAFGDFIYTARHTVPPAQAP